VQEPGTRGVGGGEADDSTRGAGEEGETQQDLSRRSLDTFAPEKSTTGRGDSAWLKERQSNLTVGCDRGDEEMISHTSRREEFGLGVVEAKAFLEDMDELETAVHRSQSIYLSRLEDSVQNAEFRGFLATARKEPEGLDYACAHGDGGSQDCEQAHVELFAGTSTSTKSVVPRRRQLAVAAWVEKAKEKARSKELTAEERALKWGAPAYDPVKDNWESDREVDSAKEALELCQPIGAREWWGHHCGRSDFTGRGYGTSIAQVEASRTAALSWAQRRSRLSGSDRRQIGRELRAHEGDEFSLGFAAFDGGQDVDSIVLSDHVYSVVDSGTSVTIAELASKLVGLDKTATIKIMGFNGSTSRSGGKGRMMGFATSRAGRRVAIRVPDAHHVPGAPSDLLSVSALAAFGYEFHFTKTRAWMVTPEMDVVDLEQKAGLYWLKWKRAVDPLRTESIEESERPNKKGADKSYESDVRADGEIKLADSNLAKDATNLQGSAVRADGGIKLADSNSSHVAERGGRDVGRARRRGVS